MFQIAGFGISLKKLAPETVHHLIVAQSVFTGIHVGLRVNEAVAISKECLVHEITAVKAMQREE